MQEEIYKPKHNPWVIAVTVTLATIMEVLDTSIANVALPHIAGSLGGQRLGSREAFCRRTRPPNGIYRTRRRAPDRIPSRQPDLLIPMARRPAARRAPRSSADRP